jgi:exopolyphosphatase/guanosine-5'-triphosphate,3'-diphosphate pyrophosphatase
MLFRLAILLNQKRQPELRPTVQLHANEHSLTVGFYDPTWLSQYSLLAADLEQEESYWRAINIQLIITPNLPHASID